MNTHSGFFKIKLTPNKPFFEQTRIETQNTQNNKASHEFKISILRKREAIRKRSYDLEYSSV